MILEWDSIEFQLISSVDAAGTAPGLPALEINEPMAWNSHPLGYYLLDRSKCQSGAARRITRNNLAQADGEITHRKFKSGHVIELNVQLWETLGQPACAGVLRKMGDVLSEYLEAISNNDGQLIWFPSTWSYEAAPNPRMLDAARSMGPSGNDSSGSSFVSVIVEEDPAGPLVTVTFALLSKFPYITDYMNYPTTPDETTSMTPDTPPAWCGSGSFFSASITNAGSAAYSPLIRVYGQVNYFQLANLSTLDEIGNPLTIVYDDTLIGAAKINSGDYLEIDTFTNRAQIFLPGGGTDNGKPGIDARQTDYFQLVPGVNDLALCYEGAGVGADIIWRNAWD